MPAHKKNDINLLPQKGFEATTTGRVVGWFLGTFRIILIVTEVVVMGAFFSRFYLDAKNSDLSEQIQQKKAVIESFTKTEKDFRSVQNKLKLYSQLAQTTDRNSKILNTIRVSLPERSDELNLKSIQVSSDGINLRGVALNEKNVLQFMTNLDNSEVVQKVTLNSISGSGDTPYLNFDLSMSPESSVQKE